MRKNSNYNHGIVQSFICSPMELAKTRIQVQKNIIFNSPLQCLSSIWKTEGTRGVFRGLNMTILREGWGFGVYFVVWEWLTRSQESAPLSTVQMLAAGGSSGAASWLCTYPMDVIKSRIQADGVSGKRLYRNSLDCLMKSKKSEGLRFLFRGLTPTLVRAFPTNAATWAVFTWIMNCAKINADQKTHKSRPIKSKRETTQHFFDGFTFS